MRRRLIAAVVVAGIALALAAGAYVVLRSRYEGQLRIAARPGITLSRGGASLARGAYLFGGAARCASCHGADAGGAYVLHDALLGILWGPNLTRGNASTPDDPSVGQRYSDADFERAIRRGVRPNGQRLLAMPSWDYARMSDADVASLVAYLRAVPPVARPAAEFRLGPLGRLDVVDGALAFDADRIGDAPPHALSSRGEAVAREAGCMRCHAAAGAPPALPTQHRGPLLASLRDAGSARFAAVPEHASLRLNDDDVRALRAFLSASAAARRERTAARST